MRDQSGLRDQIKDLAKVVPFIVVKDGDSLSDRAANPMLDGLMRKNRIGAANAGCYFLQHSLTCMQPTFQTSILSETFSHLYAPFLSRICTFSVQYWDEIKPSVFECHRGIMNTLASEFRKAVIKNKIFTNRPGSGGDDVDLESRLQWVRDNADALTRITEDGRTGNTEVNARMKE